MRTRPQHLRSMAMATLAVLLLTLPASAQLAVVDPVRDLGRKRRVILRHDLEAGHRRRGALHHRLDESAGRAGALDESDQAVGLEHADRAGMELSGPVIVYPMQRLSLPHTSTS